MISVVITVIIIIMVVIIIIIVIIIFIGSNGRLSGSLNLRKGYDEWSKQFVNLSVYFIFKRQSMPEIVNIYCIKFDTTVQED